MYFHSENRARISYLVNILLGTKQKYSNVVVDRHGKWKTSQRALWSFAWNFSTVILFWCNYRASITGSRTQSHYIKVLQHLIGCYFVVITKFYWDNMCYRRSTYNCFSTKHALALILNRKFWGFSFGPLRVMLCYHKSRIFPRQNNNNSKFLVP